MNELSDPPFVLIFDIHRINTNFLFNLLINTRIESLQYSILNYAIVLAYFHNKLAIQPGYFELMFW